MQTFKTEDHVIFTSTLAALVREGVTFEATEVNGYYTITFTGGF